jgi:hypothetical protein
VIIQNRRGDDPLFLNFEGFSRQGDGVVHLRPVGDSESADGRAMLCGLVLRSGWHRFADQHPDKLFQVCAECARQAGGLP